MDITHQVAEQRHTGSAAGEESAPAPARAAAPARANAPGTCSGEEDCSDEEDESPVKKRAPSVIICDCNADYIVTLYGLRRLSGRPPDYT